MKRKFIFTSAIAIGICMNPLIFLIGITIRLKVF